MKNKSETIFHDKNYLSVKLSKKSLIKDIARTFGEYTMQSSPWDFYLADYLL